MTVRQPNIVLILADNLGWGELGCYGGGVLRGAPTPRIDALAAEGLTCLNFNVESDCVPTRSALMTGRHPIRTGAMQSVPAGLPQGLIPWEVTIAQLAAGRQATRRPATASGTWATARAATQGSRLRRMVRHSAHLERSHVHRGAGLRSHDRADALRDGRRQGRAGAQSRSLRSRTAAPDRRRAHAADDRLHGAPVAGRAAVLRLCAARRNCISRPCRIRTSPGGTGAGDFADAMAEMDHRVGEILDAIDRLGRREDTLVLFGSDNGPSSGGRGAARRGRGAAPTTRAMEGGARACRSSCAGRGRIAPRRSTDVLHITDLYPTTRRSSAAPACRPTAPSTGSTNSAFSHWASVRHRLAKGFPITSRPSSGPLNGATGRCISCGRSSPTRGRSSWRRLSLQSREGSRGGDRREHGRRLGAWSDSAPDRVIPGPASRPTRQIPPGARRTISCRAGKPAHEARSPPAFIACCLALSAFAAAAQDWPSKPIRIVVPFLGRHHRHGGATTGGPAVAATGCLRRGRQQAGRGRPHRLRVCGQGRSG